ncbi:hypothetical protein AC629_36750, partial [Bradyrhizobium sp. NAS80.1]|uniref:MBL fold metallo-hydrolase n=1 Tax=Bradyrhizobium sp. NAS80.1 TaxID=1680159 RepID=UPI00096471BC
MSETLPSIQAATFAIGDFRLFALSDGEVSLDPVIFAHPEAVIEAKAQAARAGSETLQTAVNAYLLKSRERTILIDAGDNRGFGTETGQLIAAMKQVGIGPEDIDIVLLTHMHVDHVGHLADAAGSAVFRNAQLLVPDREWSFWWDDGTMSRAPAARLSAFKTARNATQPYKSCLHRFSDNEKLFSGVTAVSLPGHSPGHTGYLIDSNGDSVFIFGDVVHGTNFQFLHPEWGVAFDQDPELAASTRKRAFEMAAS